MCTTVLNESVIDLIGIRSNHETNSYTDIPTLKLTSSIAGMVPQPSRSSNAKAESNELSRRCLRAVCGCVVTTMQYVTSDKKAYTQM